MPTSSLYFRQCFNFVVYSSVLHKVAESRIPIDHLQESARSSVEKKLFTSTVVKLLATPREDLKIIDTCVFTENFNFTVETVDL